MKSFQDFGRRQQPHTRSVVHVDRIIRRDDPAAIGTDAGRLDAGDDTARIDALHEQRECTLHHWQIRIAIEPSFVDAAGEEEGHHRRRRGFRGGAVAGM